MNIAIDISQIIYGTGVSRYTQCLVETFLNLETEHNFTLFGYSLTRSKEMKLLINRLKVEKKIYPIPSKVVQLFWNNLHILSPDSLLKNIDLIHTSDWVEPPTKKTKVTTIHDLSFFIDPTYVSDNIRQVHKKKLFWVKNEVDRIIAVSQSTKNDIVKYLDIDPHRIDVIHEASTIQKSAPQGLKQLAHFFSSKGINKHYFLVPGSGHKRKNVVNTIKGFINSGLKDHQLVIIGSPTSEELAAKTPNVIFTGFVPSVDLPLYYEHAEGLLYPSLYEGFGLPILDAFKLNLPVLTSNTSSLPEIAGNAAIIVSPESPESIADGVSRLLNSKQALIKKGRRRLKDFSWKKTAKETLRIYQFAHDQRQ